MQGEQRAQQRQRKPGRDPVRGAFRQHRQFERHRRKDDQIESAILVIRLVEPIERQQCREQRRHPKDPGGDAPQNLRLGTDTERKQDHGENKKAEDQRGVAALSQGEAKVAAKEAEKRRHFNRRDRGRSAARRHRARGAPRHRARSPHASPPARARPRLDAPRSPVRAGPGHRRRARWPVRRAARAAPEPPTAGRAPAAAAGRPTASGTASRQPPRGRRRPARAGRRGAAGVETAQRAPRSQRLARRQHRLHRIQVADIVEPGTMPDEVGARPAPHPTRDGPPAGASKPATSRNRLDLPLPFAPVRISAPPAGKPEREPGEDQPRARAGSQDPRRSGPGPRTNRDRLPERVIGQKRRLRRGNPEPLDHRPTLLDRVTRFGGQTCKAEPYAYAYGARIGTSV